MTWAPTQTEPPRCVSLVVVFILTRMTLLWVMVQWYISHPCIRIASQNHHQLAQTLLFLDRCCSEAGGSDPENVPYLCLHDTVCWVYAVVGPWCCWPTMVVDQQYDITGYLNVVQSHHLHPDSMYMLCSMEFCVYSSSYTHSHAGSRHQV